MVWTNPSIGQLEGKPISVLGELTLQQADAESILNDARGTDDRSFAEGLISSSEYADDTVVIDIAVIFRSLAGGGDIRQNDVLQAINFLDYADTMRLEVRRSGSNKDENPGSDRETPEG